MSPAGASRPPWPGGAAAAAGQGPDVDPAVLDAALRELAARAVRERPAAIAADPWRQQFHVQPPVGLLNDPNGLVQHQGTYHLCYQWHPFGPKHALKFWAHVTSTDLVRWSAPEVALAPSRPYESHGCYSGSGIVADGQVRVLYTGNVRTPDGGRTPYQLLATLDADGTFAKDAANPIVGTIPGCSPHVRDPKVWQRDGRYWMVLGAQTEDLHGTVLLLSSPDLRSWTLLGPIAGTAQDPYGYMWECPDLLHLDGREVLVISPQFDDGEAAGARRWRDVSVYAVGSLDTAAPSFERHGAFRPIDAGPDFYAPQTFVAEDGRTIMLGWFGMPDHDGQPPLEQKHPSAANGWVHCLTVPREVRLQDGDLVQWPVAELAALREGAGTGAALRLAAGQRQEVPGAAGTALDLQLTAVCEPGAALTLQLRDGAAGRPVQLVFDPHAGTVQLDRRLLGTGEGGVAAGAVRPGGTVDARVLLDHSSVEVFVDGGRLAMSARIYPRDGQDGVTLAASGRVDADVRVWQLRRA
jgi:beta-fructofuranosidase